MDLRPEIEPIIEEIVSDRPLGEARTTDDYMHYATIGAPVQEQGPPIASNIPDFLLNTRPPTMSLPQFAETNIKRLPAADDDGTGIKEFDEQFYQQDTKSTGPSIGKAPWMKAIETSDSAPTREEKVLVHPSLSQIEMTLEENSSLKLNENTTRTRQ